MTKHCLKLWAPSGVPDLICHVLIVKPFAYFNMSGVYLVMYLFHYSIRRLLHRIYVSITFQCKTNLLKESSYSRILSNETFYVLESPVLKSLFRQSPTKATISLSSFDQYPNIPDQKTLTGTQISSVPINKICNQLNIENLINLHLIFLFFFSLEFGQLYFQIPVGAPIWGTKQRSSGKPHKGGLTFRSKGQEGIEIEMANVHLVVNLLSCMYTLGASTRLALWLNQKH